jgi:quercetin dioxygenase-like cupin family protein
MIVSASDCPVLDVAAGVSRQILAHDPHLMVVRVVFRKDAIGYVHTHPHRQVTYVERGRFEVSMGEERRVVEPGDTFYAAPDVPHGVVALEDGVLIDVFSPAREDFLA